MQKRELILKTALELFLRQGYERTNLKQIVAITGGSLATIYKLFSNKNNLFFEAIKYKHEAEVGELLALLKSSENLKIEEFLVVFGRDYLNFYTSEQNLLMLRLLVSRIYADKEIAKKIQTEHKRIILIYLSEVFSQKLSHDKLKSIELANLYFGLLKSSSFAEALFREMPNKEEDLLKHSQKISEFFLSCVNIKKV